MRNPAFSGGRARQRTLSSPPSSATPSAADAFKAQPQNILFSAPQNCVSQPTGLTCVYYIKKSNSPHKSDVRLSLYFYVLVSNLKSILRFSFFSIRIYNTIVGTKSNAIPMPNIRQIPSKLGTNTPVKYRINITP